MISVTYTEDGDTSANSTSFYADEESFIKDHDEDEINEEGSDGTMLECFRRAMNGEECSWSDYNGNGTTYVFTKVPDLKDGAFYVGSGKKDYMECNTINHAAKIAWDMILDTGERVLIKWKNGNGEYSMTVTSVDYE